MVLLIATTARYAGSCAIQCQHFRCQVGDAFAAYPVAFNKRNHMLCFLSNIIDAGGVISKDAVNVVCVVLAGDDAPSTVETQALGGTASHVGARHASRNHRAAGASAAAGCQ